MEIGIAWVGLALPVEGAPAGKAPVVTDEGGRRHPPGNSLIASIEEGDRKAGAAVAPATANLLVEAVEGLGQGSVDHGAHVRLVHAHAERGGGDHAVELIIDPVADNPLALGVGRFAVEAGDAGITRRAKLPVPVPRILSRSGIEDEGPWHVTQEFEQALALILPAADPTADVARLRSQVHSGDELKLFGRTK